MISNVNKTVTDLTAYVRDTLDKNNLEYDESVIQRIIYKIKMELGYDHPLYDKIPYYRHYSGPVSDAVKKSFKHIKTPEDNDKVKLNPLQPILLINGAYLPVL